MASGSDQTNNSTGKEIRVRGLVQGVGFRPTVWQLARRFNLVGEVLNDGEGVLIHIWGSDQNTEYFIQKLRDESPPLSRIDAVECTDYPHQTSSKEFSIVASIAGPVTTSIVPDAATCRHCLHDVFDIENRRHRYPFTNCTHCGPRLSITRAIPYDRANTSMSVFAMCENCQSEYDDPGDRRFHAQPNACPACGPRLWLSDGDGNCLSLPEETDAICQAAKMIAQGQILAIKGIGGFHLACDASNDKAVATLRKRKKRYDKPLALMADSVEMIKEYATVPGGGAEALRSTAAPIVVLQKKQNSRHLSNSLAPGHTTLGFMLPYTPMHHLLLNEMHAPLVMTSGNLSDEPQAIDNDEALARLAEIADYWLMHDREIVNRLDDSVIQEVCGQSTMLRRARGYAPDSLVLPAGFKDAPNILAMGGELKNTFCLLKNGQAIVSQHIGDLEDAGVHADYRKALDLYQTANSFVPERVAVDMHPEYFSTRWGENICADNGYFLDPIQHHHAHIAACLVEHQMAIDCQPVVGIALDGLGYGDDDTLWGGEFLIADYCTFERVAHFNPVAIPGGAKASYEPWRNTFAHLHAGIGWPQVEKKYGSLELVTFLNKKPLRLIEAMIERNLNAPKISSAGRLFDAVAGAIGICREAANFEGQAAMELQALAESCQDEEWAYGFDAGGTIGWAQMWTDILDDLQNGVTKARIAARFHNTLIISVSLTALRIAKNAKIETVVLSGGVFQNRLLCEGVFREVSFHGLKVLVSRKFPVNDGGISLGQAVISAARSIAFP